MIYKKTILQQYYNYITFILKVLTFLYKNIKYSKKSNNKISGEKMNKRKDKMLQNIITIIYKNIKFIHVFFYKKSK